MATQAPAREVRVVIESSNRETAADQMEALEGAGCSVVVCPGPDGLPGGVCPAVNGGTCAWVDAADVVLHDLDVENPVHQQVLHALRLSHPDLPVVIEVPERAALEHAALLAGCHVVYPFDMNRLVQAVLDAAATSEGHARGLRTAPPTR